MLSGSSVVIVDAPAVTASQKANNAIKISNERRGPTVHVNGSLILSGGWVLKRYVNQRDTDGMSIYLERDRGAEVLELEEQVAGENGLGTSAGLEHEPNSGRLPIIEESPPRERGDSENDSTNQEEINTEIDGDSNSSYGFSQYLNRADHVHPLHRKRTPINIHPSSVAQPVAGYGAQRRPRQNMDVLGEHIARGRREGRMPRRES